MTELGLSADELLTTTRSVRKRLDFDRPVETHLIKECLQIALQAPTRSNGQSRHLQGDWVALNFIWTPVPVF